MQNRVQETTTTGGTGTITLAGAVTGYITFAAGFTTGDVLFYTIDNGIGEWEIGIGTLVTTGTLSRTTVIASSNSGALVNFSSGTKRVFCSAPTRSLVPDQDSKSGYVLTTDGTNPSWTQTLNSVNIGNTTAGTGAFTTLSASSTVSGTGFSNYLASPPAIGGSSPAAGSFTTLTTSSTVTLNGGTANGVGYLNASKVLTTGTALVFDGANLGIGLGGVTPTLRLQVNGTVGFGTSNAPGANGSGLAIYASDFPRLTLRNSSTGDTTSDGFQLYLVGNDVSYNNLETGYQRWLVGNAEAMRIDSSGNVGIGTSIPNTATRLHVANSNIGTLGVVANAMVTTTDAQGLNVGGVLGLGGSVTTGSPSLNMRLFGAIKGAKEDSVDGSTAGYLSFFTMGSFTTTPIERLRISSTGVVTIGSAISLDPTTANALVVNSSGNVGIGVGSPVLTLDVERAASSVFSGTGYRVSRFTSTSAAAADKPGVILGFDTSGAGIVAAATQSTGQPLAFWTYNGSTWGERARITSAGNLLVGTTSDPSGSNKLRVANSILSDLAIGSGAHFDTSNATRLSVGTSSNALLISGTGYYLVLIAETAQTGNTALFLLGNGSVVLISQNGGAWVASTTPSTSQFSIGQTGGNYRLYNGFNTGSGYAFSANIIRCF
jgi:hypothetical protein